MKKKLLAGLLAGLTAVAAWSYTDNKATKLGTNTGDFQCGDIKVSGNDILGSDGVTRITFSGSSPNITLIGDVSSNGMRVDAPTTYTIGASTTITPTSTFGVLTSTGGAITWAGSPSIATTSFSNGTSLMLFSTTTTNITLTDSATLQLSTTATSTNRILDNPGDNIVLRYYSGVWYEVSFSTGH